jgi:hypothetical protein
MLVTVFLIEFAAFDAAFFMVFIGACINEPVFRAVLLEAFIFEFILLKTTDCYNNLI